MTRAKLISIYISRAAISLLLILAPAVATAQSKPKVTLPEKDSIAFFRGAAVSVDIVGPAQLAFGDYGQYEAALRINLKDKYFPIIELGYGKADAEDISTKITYKTSAPYGRIGVDFNLMKNKHDIYRLYGGVRYAYTNFKYDMFSPGLTDPVWGDRVEYKANDVKCYYHWLEFVFGVDAKIWGPIRLGWSVRYKRRMMHEEGELGNAWYVPGYGKTGSSRLGGTFNIIFEI
jgi:hypothetical protein